jgi:hypothetical protein
MTKDNRNLIRSVLWSIIVHCTLFDLGLPLPVANPCW